MLRACLSASRRRPLALQFARRGAFVQPRNRALPAQLRKARLRGEPPEKWPLAIKTAQTIDGVISHLFLLGFWPSTWLVFFFGAFLGSGALTARWMQTAARPPNDDDADASRKARKERRAAIEQQPAVHGALQEWSWLWWPRWRTVGAELREGLLLHAHEPGAPRAAAPATPAGGRRAEALPLAGATVERVECAGGRKCVRLTTERGDGASLRLLQGEGEAERWIDGLRAAAGSTTAAARVGSKTAAARRRVVSVDYPPTWEPPYEGPSPCRLVPLAKTDGEYKRVEQLALRQQYTGRTADVKGKLAVTGVSRVQSPHVWEQYSMRRAITASENEGDAGERLLWHGTTVPSVCCAEGFDPRVCALNGMFGGGVYFADKSTKSLRYAGASRPGDSGKLLLCRVALGRPMLKFLPQPNLRRPPDPMPLFPSHVGPWLRGEKFHSVFASANMGTLLMNEYIVYHTCQAYPEYVVSFELR